ncbi:hypothetical protein PsorP6_005377 [Peronosclerospora sorghi]|uniref:Uncharacterized protein n=1 Tax=Peronosclerospora sorghi TaxID=230839 RepID=A0ACC0W345_9STRA|nr:hypothetical protein PsorP6_005377 [Peronosclerospora sorghi]
MGHITSVYEENNISVLPVNNNGIKTNGHLFVEQMLAKYSLACVQEDKFRDKTNFSTFVFHLNSRFKYEIYVDDPNSHLDPPTRGRKNRFLIGLLSDFPGFKSSLLCRYQDATSR